MIEDGRLSNILLKTQTLEHDKLQRILGRSKAQGASLYEYLLKANILTSEDIAGAVMEITNYSYLRLNDVTIHEEAYSLVAEDFCRQHTLIPVSIVENVLTVSVEDILEPSVHSELQQLTGMTVIQAVSDTESIVNAIQRSYGTEEEVQGDDLEEIVEETTFDELIMEAGVEEETEVDVEGMETNENDSLIVKLVNSIIVEAFMKGASDIHIESYWGTRKKTRIRIRIDGVLMEYRKIPNQYINAVVARIKIMSKLDITERRIPQDGKIKFRLSSQKQIELRVATVPVAGNREDVVLRILASQEPIPFGKLGFIERNYEEIKDAVVRPYGIILVVGPTGSGKTTTLHSLVAHINTVDRKIWTVEDPVEITQYGIRQVQIEVKRGLTFPKVLRSFLRADPDVIMVGEIRDVETATIAIEASLTGHIVFSTLHTNTAPETITRLLEMELDPFSFADSLVAVLAQRLVRNVCKNCREEYHPDEKEYKYIKKEFGPDYFDAALEKIPDFEYNDSLMLSRHNSKGCEACSGTGYRGRTGIHELVMVTDEMRHMIVTRASVSEIRKLAIENGMFTLKQDGIVKVFRGLTDIAQVRRTCAV